MSQGMDVWEAIRTRRTISRFQPEPLPRQTLLRLLEAGIWAPNHHLTEPWRFVVVGPETQRRLAERFGELRMSRIPADDSELRRRAREDGIRKLMSVPTLVAVATIKEGDAQQQREDYAAVSCAVQNIQLAAWAEGIGAKWSTNLVTRDPTAYALLALEPERYDIIGFLYLGFPVEVPNRERRRSVEDVTSWCP